MKNFTKQAKFFKGICKKALLMISKFIDLGSLMKEVATAFPFVGHKEGRVLLDFSIPFVLSSMLGNKCLPAMHHVHYGCVC